MSEVLEVVKWYEEHLGRKLTELEKASIRNQVVINKFDMPEIKDERLEDCLLIGYDKSHDGKDKTILTVGRKENDSVNIIVWFENEKAEKLHKWLTGEVDFE